MKAVILATGRRLAPFGDPVGEVLVLGRPLARVQREAIEAAGLEPAAAPPSDEAYLLVSDRTWITSRALRLFLAAARAPARMRVDDPTWLENTAPLQEWPSAGLYEIGLVPAGGEPRFDGLPPVTVDIEVETAPPPIEHPALAHALPGAVPVTDAGVHQLDHWVHLLRVNWLAMGAVLTGEWRRFRRAPWWLKAWMAIRFALRARSLDRFRVAGRLSRLGRGCVVHPTAVVEASVLGQGVEVGPFAVVRGSVVGDGARIEEFAAVNASVVGAGARVGRRATANLCVLYPGSFVSAAQGFQATVVGRDAFVAWSATVFDLSFDRPVKVWKDGRRVSSGTCFLGACIGHRARVGGQVTLGYGAELPNDAFVVGPSDGVLRSWEEGEGPHRVAGGVARPVRSGRG